MGTLKTQNSDSRADDTTMTVKIDSAHQRPICCGSPLKPAEEGCRWLLAVALVSERDRRLSLRATIGKAVSGSVTSEEVSTRKTPSSDDCLLIIVASIIRDEARSYQKIRLRCGGRLKAESHRRGRKPQV